MSVPYNPFELLDLQLLKDMLRRHQYFLVIQRLIWPGVPSGRGFMVSAYKEQKPARQHTEKLPASDGRMLDLRLETEKVTALINDPRYLLYLGTFRDRNGPANVLKHYQKNIASFLISNSISASTGIELTFQHGILKAVVQCSEGEKIFNAYDLVK